MPEHSARPYVGVEAGGTKFLVGVGTGPDDLSEPVRIPTTSPAETLPAVLDAVDRLLGGRDAAAVGIATFGPVDLDPTSPTHGHLVGTPKPGWDGIDVLTPFRTGLGGPVAIDTDVNGAALGENRWGAGRGLDPLLYLTVGTGVGGGALVGGKPLQGVSHPEMGHVPVRRHPDDDFPGRCPFHGNCLEGMVAGPALEERWGRRDGRLGVDDATLVELVGWYVGQLVCDAVLLLSPRRVIIGGGVMHRAGTLTAIEEHATRLLAGYPRLAAAGPRPLVVAPGLADRAGILGAIVLAERAHADVSARRDP